MSEFYFNARKENVQDNEHTVCPLSLIDDSLRRTEVIVHDYSHTRVKSG